MRVVAVALLSVFSALVSPAALHGQQAPPPQQHDHSSDAPQAPAAPGMPADGDMMAMMMRMHAADAKLDVLVKKMNEATGSAKTDAMAEVLTAMVDKTMACERMMQDMTGMMNMPGGHGRGAPMMPEKK